MIVLVVLKGVLVLIAQLSMRLKTAQQLVLPFKLCLYILVQCISNMLKCLEIVYRMYCAENQSIIGH